MRIIAETSRQISQLEKSLQDRSGQYPDNVIQHSQLGLGTVLRTRALGEFGDNPDRYTSTDSRGNHAGTSPITVASGRKHTVMAHHVRNRRLFDALDQWAFCSLARSPRRPSFLALREDVG